MADYLESTTHLLHPAQAGLYAKPDLPAVRGLGVFGIIFTSLITVGLGAVIVVVWHWDSVSPQGGRATAGFFTLALFPWVIYNVGSVRTSMWRIAVLQRKIPVVAFAREGMGLVVVPVRYMGIRHGRVHFVTRGSNHDKDAPLILKPGDEVNLAIEGSEFIPSRSRIRLLLDAREGYFRSRVGLSASELDLEGFEAFMAARGISLTYGSLYEP
ncbi:MAG: hypothetical protein JW722_07705 [Demequinaceae bacterium]|nr:hypothetical protein [Demequinaceae bacterium]